MYLCRKTSLNTLNPSYNTAIRKTTIQDQTIPKTTCQVTLEKLHVLQSLSLYPEKIKNARNLACGVWANLQSLHACASAGLASRYRSWFGRVHAFLTSVLFNAWSQTLFLSEMLTFFYLHQFSTFWELKRGNLNLADSFWEQ